jgi:predicted dehydrogenase
MQEQSQRYGVGIVGIGFGRAVHLPALRADPRVEVAAVAASTAERAQRIARECGIPKAYGDWRQMLADRDLKAVTIAVPPELQAEIALAALQAGKHVFCEKPLAHSAAAAARLADAADAGKRANLVDFEFSAVRQWMAAKRLLDRGAIGPVRHAHVNWHVETYAIQKRVTSWKTELPGGGMLMSFVSHCFQYLAWLAGPIDRLRATLHRQAGDPGDADTIDQIEVHFRSGAYGTVTASCNAPRGTGHRVEIYGECGSLCLENRTREYLNGFTIDCSTRDGPVTADADIAETPEAVDSQDGRVATVAVLMRRFVDWIESAPARPLGPAACDFREGLRVQRLIDAARRSHAAGDWIAISEDDSHV